MGEQTRKASGIDGASKEVVWWRGISLAADGEVPQTGFPGTMYSAPFDLNGVARRIEEAYIVPKAAFGQGAGLASTETLRAYIKKTVQYGTEGAETENDATQVLFDRTWTGDGATTWWKSAVPVSMGPKTRSSAADPATNGDGQFNDGLGSALPNPGLVVASPTSATLTTGIRRSSLKLVVVTSTNADAPDFDVMLVLSPIDQTDSN